MTPNRPEIENFGYPPSQNQRSYKHEIETKWLRWGHDLKYQVWSRSPHWGRSGKYATYNTSWQGNLFLFCRNCSPVQVAPFDRFLRMIAQNVSFLNCSALPGTRKTNSPILPHFYPKNGHFWAHPMYFQWGALRAVVTRLINRMWRFIAQTIHFDEFFHMQLVKIANVNENPKF